MFFIIIKILKRNPFNRLNQIFALFYFSMMMAIFINAVYITFSDVHLETLATLLNITAFYFSCLAAGFLFLCISLLYKPSFMVKTKNQLLFIAFYGGILLYLFFIEGGAKVVILDTGTQLAPVWNLLFVGYALSILIATLIISLLMSVKVYRDFTDVSLAKRFKYFIIGTICFYYIPLGVSVSNLINITAIRIFFTFTASVIFIGAIFIYYGIGVSLSKKRN
ncbi:MAG: hypothetical protein GF383_14140 [Candidatus Lokiarchaeota archaeon]|nr:hypothetical protein [Candidatus Lokiarchaeota archaeon]MBD3342480.1 hypothetical protein [Candidatus Lokiarchaeota archaeon]